MTEKDAIWQSRKDRKTKRSTHSTQTNGMSFSRQNENVAKEILTHDVHTRSAATSVDISEVWYLSREPEGLFFQENREAATHKAEGHQIYLKTCCQNISVNLYFEPYSSALSFYSCFVCFTALSQKTTVINGFFIPWHSWGEWGRSKDFINVLIYSKKPKEMRFFVQKNYFFFHFSRSAKWAKKCFFPA